MVILSDNCLEMLYKLQSQKNSLLDKSSTSNSDQFKIFGSRVDSFVLLKFNWKSSESVKTVFQIKSYEITSLNFSLFKKACSSIVFSIKFCDKSNFFNFFAWENVFVLILSNLVKFLADISRISSIPMIKQKRYKCSKKCLNQRHT